MSLVTPEFRVSWPKLFKPELNQLNQKMEYSVVALFKKGADLKMLELAAKKAIEEKWGADKTKWPQNLKLPFKKQTLTRLNKNGETVPNAGHEEGAVFINLKSTQKVGIVDQKVQPIIDETQIYSGCWAIAQVNAYAFDQKGNRGVAFGLQNIQKVRDDEPLAGRMRPEDAFAPIEGTDTTVSSANDLFG